MAAAKQQRELLQKEEAFLKDLRTKLTDQLNRLKVCVKLKSQRAPALSVCEFVEGEVGKYYHLIRQWVQQV